MLVFACSLACAASTAMAQDGVIQKGTAKGTSGFADLKLMGANSADAAIVIAPEVIMLTGGGRFSPPTKPELRLDPRSPSKSFSFGAAGGWGISDVERASEAVIRLRNTRAGSTACVARVPAAYRAAGKVLELQLGDAKRFFDNDGKPQSALCNNEVLK
jgi:hypothetical protein